MNIYQHASSDLPKADRVLFKALAGYTITQADAAQAEYHSAPATTTITGSGLVRVDTGLTLDEAHVALTDGLTKTQLVDLGSDFGLSLSETSIRDELLESIRTYLQNLASE